MKTEIAKIINVPVVINNSVQICSKLNIFQHKGEKILNLLEDSQYLPTYREGIWLLELQWGANKL